MLLTNVTFTVTWFMFFMVLLEKIMTECERRMSETTGEEIHQTGV